MLSAINSEIGPTLPKYMVTIITNFPRELSVDVKFLVRPTVAVALTVSYMISSMSDFVIAHKRIVDTDIIANETAITATDLLTDCLGIDLCKREVSSLLFMVAIAEATSTAAVTVLIPPAVPVGEPPINMRIRETNDEALVRFSCGILANPAVLVVMD